MACQLPFNIIKVGSTTIAGPKDFIYGSGSLSLKGDDSAVTTADGRIHNFRNALTPEASCEVRGDKRSVGTAYPDGDAASWPELAKSVTLAHVDSRDGTETEVKTFSAIVAAEYDTRENKTSLTLKGSDTNYQ